MTCGSTTVSAIGNCTGCGAFRGAETAQPAYGQQPQHYEQYQQPQFGQSGPAQPAPGQYPPPDQYPQGQGQYPPPQYPAQQYAQPYAQPAQQRRSNTGLIIAIVVGILVLLLGGGTAVAVVAYNNRDDPTTRGGPTEPTTSTPASADQCVVGVWKETQSNYVTQVEGVAVNMTASGSIQRFNADGTGELDMTPGIVATGTAGGKKYERTTTGKIAFKYHPQDDKIHYTDVSSTGSSTTKVDGVARAAVAVSGSIDPDTYTCSGNTFVQSGDTYRIQLERQ
jgi:hypothetical protein